jgi:putative DNA primase/helicase
MSANPDRANYLTAADIHARVEWPTVLAALGIDGKLLEIKRDKRSKPSPCPACGGRDRFFFDNRTRRGDYFCRGCGSGDGFRLLERVHGWTFSEARQQVMNVAGLTDETPTRTIAPSAPAAIATPAVAKPTQRVRAVLRGSCAVSDCPDAVAYLTHRGLWPLPEGCTLRAHPALDYWEGGQRVGRYPGLVAEVRDLDDQLVTVHITYLNAAQKLTDREPRKLLGPLTGREGCAVRLMAATDTLGIAEGIETALSAAAQAEMPVWAALNTSLLGKFEPPPAVKRLVICADRDTAGLLAAARLMERLQGRMRFELRVPRSPHKDFNDQVTACTGDTHA